MLNRLRAARSAALVALALVFLLLAATTAPAQTGSDPDAPRYDFYSVQALADGITVELEVVGFLPIEEFVGLSSVTSEAHLGLNRSDAFAALPDPGDLIVTLPTTLAALLGLAGIPAYPAAVFAEHPLTPTDDLALAPDAGLGLLQLHSEAQEDGSSATAFVGDLVDTVGLVPLSIGSVRTTAEVRRIRSTAFESVATSTVGDLRLLGGLLRIGEITSSVRTSVVDGRLAADAPEVVVTGVSLAGTPVGITDEGIVGLGSPTALAPIVDTLLAPLLSRGIEVRTTPAGRSTDDTTAEAFGGSLSISLPLNVAGYPGSLELTIGRVSSAVEVGGLRGLDDGSSDDGGSSGSSTGGTGTGSGGVIRPSGSVTSPTASRPSSAGAVATDNGDGTTDAVGGFVSLPVTRQIADWQVATLYRWLFAASGVLLLAGAVATRASRRGGRRRTELRPLWRW